MKKAFWKILLVSFLCSCGPPRNKVIVVGAKDFPEQTILGEILAQVLHQKTGLQVERRFYLGGTYICQQALLAGRIDVDAEYAGTALTAILKQPIEHNPENVYRRVKQLYASRFNLAVMPPLGFNDTFVLVVRGETARKDHIQTISQAVPYAVHWRPGFGYEFMERKDGYYGLVKTYGLKFGTPPRLMDLGLIYRALLDHQVDIVAGNSTDSQLEAHNFAVLKDNKHYFPPYQAVPIVRRQTLQQHPAVRTALEQLGGKVSEAAMRHLNYEVVAQHRSVKEVVHEFLRKEHLIP